MLKSRRGGKVLQRVILALCLGALIGCSMLKPQQPPPVVLQGNWIQAVYSSSSPGKRELKYYRIGPEALARLLEKAEACQPQK